MNLPLYHVWNYTDVDAQFWRDHLEGWVPHRLFDAHTHVMDTRFRRSPMTEAKRRQYWVNEVFEPIDAPTAARCFETVFPRREFSCLVFGYPDLEFDIEAGNAYLQNECMKRGWYNLAITRPQWSQHKLAALLEHPAVVGVKPYYTLIGECAETRDAHLEASIFDFLPHRQLEVLNDRGAWVTLHVPRARRLGHPDNLREIRELRRRYPNVVLVVAHLGRSYTEPHALEALPALADDPRIYFDTAAVLNPACFRIALEQFGPSRLLYGTDNPICYLRGRRQFRGREYTNRTSYPFHFNKDREPPEIEAQYTLLMYEDLWAIKQACAAAHIADAASISAIFHDNAARLIGSVLARKSQTISAGG